MVHEAAATRFERKADAYSRGRPAYHRELVSRVAARCVDVGVGAVVVDVGAGTGMVN